MFSLIPREMAFFDLFERAAANAWRGAQELVDLLEKFDDVAERAKRIKDIEHAGDTVESPYSAEYVFYSATR
jgi:uncharacterized protein Yka (UPF0111/DUF47 family)